MLLLLLYYSRAKENELKQLKFQEEQEQIRIQKALQREKEEQRKEEERMKEFRLTGGINFNKVLKPYLIQDEEGNEFIESDDKVIVSIICRLL